VVVDEVGVIRADAFVRGIVQGDLRFTASNIREVMRTRVARLGASLGA
jgi:hypothetical protein